MTVMNRSQLAVLNVVMIVACGCGCGGDGHKDRGDTLGEVSLGMTFDEVLSRVPLDDQENAVGMYAVNIAPLKDEDKLRQPIKVIDLEQRYGMVFEFNHKDELIRIMRVENLYRVSSPSEAPVIEFDPGPDEP